MSGGQIRARKRTHTNRPKDQLGRMDLSRDIVMTRTVF